MHRVYKYADGVSYLRLLLEEGIVSHRETTFIARYLLSIYVVLAINKPCLLHYLQQFSDPFQRMQTISLLFGRIRIYYSAIYWQHTNNPRRVYKYLADVFSFRFRRQVETVSDRQTTFFMLNVWNMQIHSWRLVVSISPTVGKETHVLILPKSFEKTDPIRFFGANYIRRTYFLRMYTRKIIEFFDLLFVRVGMNKEYNSVHNNNKIISNATNYRYSKCWTWALR